MTPNQIPFTAAANLTRDPELRDTPSGKPVAAVRLAITPRLYSAEQGRYLDGATTFVDGQIWDDLQDWLSRPDEHNWRADPSLGGGSRDR
jgi:hypothetical protein